MTANNEWLKVESLDLRGRASRAMPKARWCSSRRCPARKCRSTCTAARTTGSRPPDRAAVRERAARRAALPPLRRVRGLQAAAPGRRRAGRHEAARAGGCALARRQGQAGDGAAPDRGAGVGLSLSRACRRHVQKKGRCWSASTSASRATSPRWTAARCSAPRPHAAAPVRPHRVDGPARPPAADRGGRRRPGHGAGAASPGTARRRGPGAAARSPPRTTSSGCGRRVRTRRIRSTRAAFTSTTTEFGIPIRSGPRTSPR